MKTLNTVEDLLYVPNSIRTSKGLYLDFTNIKPELLDIEDIAHALSFQCRFGGHLPKFYSVAQHSVHCSELVDEVDAFDALMHDSSESYLLDIPKPLKNLLPEYVVIENKLMSILATKFGFNFPLSPAVKKVDEHMLRLEFNRIMLNKGKFKCWSPKVAKRKFLDRYYELAPNA
jgi:hypothetical protein